MYTNTDTNTDRNTDTNTDTNADKNTDTNTHTYTHINTITLTFYLTSTSIWATNYAAYRCCSCWSSIQQWTLNFANGNGSVYWQTPYLPLKYSFIGRYPILPFQSSCWNHENHWKSLKTLKNESGNSDSEEKFNFEEGLQIYPGRSAQIKKKTNLLWN